MRKKNVRSRTPFVGGAIRTGLCFRYRTSRHSFSGGGGVPPTPLPLFPQSGGHPPICAGPEGWVATGNRCPDERTRRFKHPTKTIPGIHISFPSTKGWECVPDVCSGRPIRHEPKQDRKVHGQIHDNEAEVHTARPAAAGSGFFRPAGKEQAPGRAAAGYRGWPERRTVTGACR